MIGTLLLTYLILGLVTVVLVAYDPFTRTFDWTMSDGGWEFSVWMRVFLWFVLIVASPYYLPKEIYRKIDDCKYAREWREKGSFKRKL